MKIGIYYLDVLVNQDYYIKEAKEIVKIVQKNFSDPFIEVDEKTWLETDANFIYICSESSASAFLDIYQSLPGPYYLIASNDYNSLSAATEILTFLNERNEYVTMIHGSIENIAERVKSYAMHNHAYKKIQASRIGVIGQASPNLIASSFDCSLIEYYHEQLGVAFIEISTSEFCEIYDKIITTTSNQYTKEIYKSRYQVEKINEAVKVYQALKVIIEQYQLDGLTINDGFLVEKYQTTACLALSILNSEGVVTSADGDLAVLVSMLIVNKLLKLPSFQASVCRINSTTNRLIMANSTVPFAMLTKFCLTSHFIKKCGVAVKGELPVGKATIFKVSKDLETCFIKNVYLNANIHDEKICPTQIELQLTTADIEYLYYYPLGNYHIVLLGHHQKTIEKFMRRIFKIKNLVKKVLI